ncbi:hypothetical protein A6F49_02305 [Enteractinococcus helveticum]|uniref:Uncharacterized protein n=2 Tax=Enteractinococcus helveticum TaxID=1837282 RepID=A0A1B7LUQ0_9MICC|nr:hypothetical protein QT23_00385 [Staphylococcus aureus]OAV51135.1 hypothetical protein A6F49_02305 [Enteractinococcus helveticum]
MEGMWDTMTGPMTSEFNFEMAQMLRDFGENLAKLHQPQWQASFEELADSFERVETQQDRSRLAKQGLAYFTRPHGLNDWLRALEGMPDAELYCILELSWALTQELLKRNL